MCGTYEIFAEKEVRIKEKISVVDERSRFDQNVEITGTTKVTKDTTLEAALEVGGDAKVKGKLDVGS